MTGKSMTYHLEAHCQKQHNKFFTCQFRSDDQGKTWLLDSGTKLKKIESPSNEEPMPKGLLNNIKIADDFHCPYCKNLSFYQCSKCKAFSCWDGRTLFLQCGNPLCNHKGKMTAGELKKPQIIDSKKPEKELEALDVVFVIDDTQSMQPAIALIKKLMLNFHQDVQKVLLDLKSFRVKFVYFRDYAEGPHAIRESRFFSLPDEVTFYQAFVKNMVALSEGDEPENGLEALYTGLFSHWSRQYERVKHLCIVLTDAPAHPIQGPQSRRDFPGYPQQIPQSLIQFDLLWRFGYQHDDGTGLLSTASLILFTPQRDTSWQPIVDWERVVHIPVKPNQSFKEFTLERIRDNIMNSLVK
jgi:hypothetical protein